LFAEVLENPTLQHALRRFSRGNSMTNNANGTSAADDREMLLRDIDRLRRRATQFETLFNQAPIGVYLIDSDFRIREVNPMARSVFESVSGDILGRDFDEVLHIIWEKKFAEETSREFRRTLETGVPYATAERAIFLVHRGITKYFSWRLDRIVLDDGRYGVVCYFRDISHRVEAEKTRHLLVTELNHRVKNTLANVQAIAQQTLRHSQSPQEFAPKFVGRIQSLARVHALLTNENWQGANLRELIRDQLLQGAIDETRLTAWGPPLRLTAQATLHLALILHELGTNSTKHGALSTAAGRVSLTWLLKGETLELQWQERGGPAVTAPVEEGFGMSLIEHTARGQGGSAEMVCEAEGITWNFVLPLPQHAAPFSGDQSQAKRAGTNAGVVTANRALLADRKFLVIEDEPLIALSLTESLKGAGARVVQTAATVEKALEFITRTRFDGVLLDANLHSRPVDEIAAALTKMNVPFIFVTGYGKQGLPAGFQHIAVLPKPHTEEQLLSIVAGMGAKTGDVIQMKR